MESSDRAPRVIQQARLSDLVRQHHGDQVFGPIAAHLAAEGVSPSSFSRVLPPVSDEALTRYREVRPSYRSPESEVRWASTPDPDLFDRRVQALSEILSGTQLVLLLQEPDVGYLRCSGRDFVDFARALLEADGNNVSAIASDADEGLELDLIEEDGVRTYEAVIWGRAWPREVLVEEL